MTFLTQPWWYWALVIVALLIARALYTSTRHHNRRAARLRLRQQIQAAQLMDDIYWQYSRERQQVVD